MMMATADAPDGGWGWMIVLANAVSNIATMSVVTSFGLIFRHRLHRLGLSATNITTITTISSACNMSMGLCTGPLLKHFGYRRIAAVGGALFVGGLLLTAGADTFVRFVAAYSVLAGAGIGLATAAFSLALHTYFRERRSRAAGVAMTLTGLGPIVYPPVIVWWLDSYGGLGCVLLLAAVSGHILVAAALLQPVEYHQRRAGGRRRAVASGGPAQKRSPTDSSEDADDYLEHAPQDRNVTALLQQGHADLQLSSNSLGERNVRFQMPAQVIDDNDTAAGEAGVVAAAVAQPPAKSNGWRPKRGRIGAWLVHQFDLDLLGDRRFVNIIVGMAVATFAEINFSVLMPFILGELDFSTGQQAGMMSTLACVDIVARLAAPFVGDWCGGTPRVMYMLALLTLVGTRMALLAVGGSYVRLLAVAVAMGAAKGVRTVYMILVIPGHVDIAKLPSAAGLRMVANMCVLLLLGPFVGFIRDLTGDYVLCIVFMNGITCLSLAMWTAEMVYCAYWAERTAGKTIQ